MDAILILAASLTTVYIVARRTGSGRVALADLLIGVFAGLAGLGFAAFVGSAGGEWRLGLPLFIAVALAFGLEALQERPAWR